MPPSLLDHPRYRPLRIIGRGGMGVVYLAEHRLMGRTVAVKATRYLPERLPALADRFLREVRLVTQLAHPNVVAVHDAEATADALILVMEYVEGEDLFQFVHRSGPLDAPTALGLVSQAALGLKHAHDRGVVHRDIKPSNLFLTSGQGGVVKVLDFGLAKAVFDTLGLEVTFGTPAGFTMGTVGYMSPEQEADARSVGVQADIFSLGRTLYFLLSGRVPYPDGPTSLERELAGEDPVIPLRQIRPDVPAAVARLIGKMTARRAADRFQSCDEVLRAIRRARRWWWRLW